MEEKVNDRSKILNEIYTLRHKGARIRLSDNTLVYLDASSHLKVPAAFTDTIRQVKYWDAVILRCNPNRAILFM